MGDYLDVREIQERNSFCILKVRDISGWDHRGQKTDALETILIMLASMTEMKKLLPKKGFFVKFLPYNIGGDEISIGHKLPIRTRFPSLRDFFWGGESIL